MMYIQQLVHIQAAFAKLDLKDLDSGSSAYTDKQEFLKKFPAVAATITALETQTLELSTDAAAISRNRVALAKLCEQQFSAWLAGLNDVNDNPIMVARLFNATAKYHLQLAVDHYFQYVEANDSLDITILRDYLRISFIVMLNRCISGKESTISDFLCEIMAVVYKFSKDNPEAVESLLLELCNEQETLQPLQLPRKHITAIRDLTIGMVPIPKREKIMIFGISPYHKCNDTPPVGQYAVDQTGPRQGQPKLKFL